MEKECFKCGVTKDISFFYKHSKMADGHLGKCKECAKADVQLNYRDKIDQYKKYDQKRNQKRKEYIKNKTNEYIKNNKEKVISTKKEWLEKNALKKAAHIITSNMIRDGKLKKMPCIICGTNVGIEAHHPLYEKPTFVIWLCGPHHRKIHWWIRWNKREYKLKQKL